MFTIGQFSTLSQVSIKTLRFYDECELLKPTYTDAARLAMADSARRLFSLDYHTRRRCQSLQSTCPTAWSRRHARHFDVSLQYAQTKFENDILARPRIARIGNTKISLRVVSLSAVIKTVKHYLSGNQGKTSITSSALRPAIYRQETFVSRFQSECSLSA